MTDSNSNSNSNPFDFRVGDVVCDCRLGTGKVYKIASMTILVLFDDGDQCRYTLDGKPSQGYPHRSLYHGTWEQVFGNLPDLKPKRNVKRWVNLYANGGWGQFNDKVSAGKDAANNATGHYKVIATAVEIEVYE